MVSFNTQKNSVNYLIISPEFVGQRIDNFLITHLKGVPRTHIYRILRKGEVRVNKGRIKPDYRLKEGDSLRIPPIRREQAAQAEGKQASLKSGLRSHKWMDSTGQALQSDILYEDEGLIVLNKPSGMAVHGGSGLSFGVIEALRHLYPRLSLELVHRLDKDTSGCLMVAKRRSTLKWLHELLRTGQLHKTYWALVKGKWQAGPAVKAALTKNQLSSGERIVRVDDQGQTAYTEFKVLKTFAPASLMEAKPLTGRTHQIRVHATSVGHPIAGDRKYGEDQFNREMKSLGLNRLFLHAKALDIPLPDGKVLTIQAPLDEVLTKMLEKLSRSPGEQHHV